MAESGSVRTYEHSAALMISRGIHSGAVPGTGEKPQTRFRSPEFWRSRKLQDGVVTALRDEGVARSRLRGRTAAAGCRSPRAEAASFRLSPWRHDESPRGASFQEARHGGQIPRVHSG